MKITQKCLNFPESSSFSLVNMRGLDPICEKQFFDLFTEFFDLEKDVGRQHNPVNYTLDRMYPLAEAAGNPQVGLKILHVAGTKGKGSTCYYLGALLNAAGKRCGVFTSPHLDTVRERFQIDGELVSYEALMEAGRELCRKIRAAGLHPSLFELFTVLALRLFADSGVEYAVMETGIGGRVDATNYIRDKEAAIITTLSYDHTALLGGTIREIALEKAAIMRPGTPLILAKQPFCEAEAVIRRTAETAGTPVFVPDSAPDGWLPVNTPDFLTENFATAWKCLTLLGITPERNSFRVPQLRARFEVLRENPPVLIDAAHNGDSARRLAAAVNRAYPGVRFTCILGAVPGKDVNGIAQGLAAMNARFILTDPDTTRGSALKELTSAARQAGLEIAAVVPGISSPDELPADEPLLFTGSFFTALIGEKLFQRS